MRQTTRPVKTESGNLLLEIANALVALHKEYFGRGPTKARAHVWRDLVVVILEGGYSQAERTLHEHGRDDAVERARTAIKETIEDAGVTAIEQLTGRKVRSFMSANDAGNELEADIFMLEPADQAASGSDELSARAQAARALSIEVREDLRALRNEQVQARLALRKQRERDR
jgi:uncharacterized protein YbcI